MFDDADSFNQDLSQWKMSEVTDTEVSFFKYLEIVEYFLYFFVNSICSHSHNILIKTYHNGTL